MVNGSTNTEFKDLDSKANYVIKLRAVVWYSKTDKSTNTTSRIIELSHQAILSVSTCPDSPTLFHAIDVGFNSVSLDWSTPGIDQSTIKGYIVKYHLMDSTGLYIQKGTEKFQTFPSASLLRNITSLASGYMYGMNLQVYIVSVTLLNILPFTTLIKVSWNLFVNSLSWIATVCTTLSIFLFRSSNDSHVLRCYFIFVGYYDKRQKQLFTNTAG